MKGNWVFFISFLTVMLQNAVAQISETSHPCKRACRTNRKMQCKYTFVIENFWTMGDFCFNCPVDQQACYNKGCVPADGWLREITVINRQLPGPDIQVCVGDNVTVTVVNRLTCDTTIHWHGEHQRNSPYMDGTPMVTQCPIPPGTNFTYHFIADTIGTHMYHSHTGFQKDDGVVGVFTTREPKGTDPNGDTYDQDLFSHAIIVQDWTHVTTEAYFMEVQRPDPVVPPLGMLVNGYGANQSYAGPPDNTLYFTPTAQFNVTRGQRYRFRAVGAGIFSCPIRISIDSHTMSVIALDGAPVEPVPVDAIDVLSGERVDFVLNANQSVGRYYIKFQGQVDCADASERTFQYAILNYASADLGSPPPGERSYDAAGRLGRILNPPNAAPGGSNDITIAKVNAHQDIPDDSGLTKAQTDYQFFLMTDHKNKSLSDFTWDTFPLLTLRTVEPYGIWTLPFNGISFRPPTYPLLTEGYLRNFYDTRDFCNEQTIDKAYCERYYCACTHLIRIPYDATVELVIVDEGVPLNSTHPVHLHGVSFRVVAMHRFGTSTTRQQVQTALGDGTIQRKLTRAPLKDTVAVPDGGVTVVRFRADNPGFWFFHCHLGMHLEIGMSLIFQVGNMNDMYTPYYDENPGEYDNYNFCGHKSNVSETFHP